MRDSVKAHALCPYELMRDSPGDDPPFLDFAHNAQKKKRPAYRGRSLYQYKILHLRSIIIKHPAHAELVGTHPETCAPKRILQRHDDVAAFRDRREGAVDLLRAAEAEGYLHVVAIDDAALLIAAV